MRHRWNVALVSIALVVTGVVQVGSVDGDGDRGDGSWHRPFRPDQVRAITSIVVSGYAAAGNPGILVGIWEPGAGSYVRAFGLGDVGTGVPGTETPLDLDDHLRIASNTKTFTATAILQLVDRGQLRLDATLESFVPGVPNGRQITVQQLLNMTAGVFPYTFDDSFLETYYADPNMSFTKDDFMAILQRHEPSFAPAEKTEYSDSNYYLLGLIVEAVTQRPLGDVIQSFIIEPLGLTHTSYPTTSELPLPFARGYIPQGDGPPRDVTISNPAVAAGAGAMLSTLGDLKIWAKALATGSLLQPATQQLRLQTTVLSSNEHVTAGYGLGILDINGFLGHDGAILGYGSVVLYLPSRDATIVVLSNGNTLFGTPSVKTAIALAAYLFPRQFPNGIE